MEPGDLIGGRFAVEALAGEGGMGRVFRATDRLSGAIVAVKVLRDSTVSRGDADRFEREAELLADLAHPSIVRYVAHGTSQQGERYLAMEWLVGETLEERIARGLTLNDALTILRQAAIGLGSTHRKGIVHRDIKPSNLFLVEKRSNDLRLIDFGIARIRRGAHTQIGAPMGTPSYMAPEQARGDAAISAAADVFSLGCVLFECLAGQPPFVGDHPLEVMSKILLERAPSVRTLNKAVAADLEALVRTMLAKEPGERPADGDAVLRALDALGTMPGAESLLPGRTSERPELTMGEQKWLSMALLAPGAARADDATMVGDGTNANLARAVAMLGCNIVSLANGSVVVVSAHPGSAADQAERVARATIAALATQSEYVAAVVTGRARISGRLPSGEVVKRAVELLRSPTQGRIRLDTSTANLLSARFVVEDESGTPVLQSERDAASIGKTSHPIFGRDAEIALLDAILGECIEEPRVHAVVLTGPPGSGKSRLKDELLRRATTRGARVWQARGEPIRAGSSLALLAQLVSAGLELIGLDPAAVRERLSARLGKRLSRSDSERDAEFLAELLHATTGAASVQLQVARRNPLLMGDQIRQAWEELVCAVCSEGPLIVVLEDLQWGDLPTVSFVDSLLRSASDLPLLVIGIGRPEIVDTFPDLWTSHDVKRVPLAPLSARASQKFARSLLGDTLPDTVVATIVERGQGNPFLLEELGRAMTEGRGDTVPESVLAMAHARLSSLDGAARRVLRAASVFGRQFWTGGVSALLGGEARTGTLEWLPLLLAKDLIFRRTPSRFAGEDEYVFRQALLGDAAYAALTDEDRVLGHRLAAEWLERIGENDPLVLAEHYARGEQPERAASHFASAALLSLTGHDFQAAVTKARAGLKGGPNGHLHLVLAEALRWMGCFAEAQLHAEEAVALLTAGSALYFQACEERSTIAVRLGRFEQAASWATQALAVEVDRSSIDVVSAYVRCLCAASRASFQAGAYPLAEELMVVVLDLVAHADPSARAEAHRLEGARARHNGDLAQDARSYALALDAFREAGDARNACNAHVSLGFAFVELGQIERARSVLEEALASAERLRLPAVATRARQNLGLVLGWCGDLTTARALLTQVTKESSDQTNVRFEGWTRIYLSNTLLALGDADAALAEATIAEALLASTPPALAGALAARARALVCGDRVSDALPVAEQAMQILTSLGAIEEFETLVRLAWVESLLRGGRLAEGQAALAEAQRRILARADAISDPALRRSFLERVPENVAIFSPPQEVAR